jgi:hypothetical protein
MMSGSLIAMGFGLIFVYALFASFLHYMFIVGFQSPMTLLVLLFPMLLVAAGTAVAMRAIRDPEAVRTWRTAIGTLLVLAPLLLLAAMPVFSVLLGSLGMDFHWNGPRALGYATVLCTGVALCVCFIIGIRLLRNANT